MDINLGHQELPQRCVCILQFSHSNLTNQIEYLWQRDSLDATRIGCVANYRT
jgi:hypothetical protein